jgi:hypothetical protein
MGITGKKRGRERGRQVKGRNDRVEVVSKIKDGLRQPHARQPKRRSARSLL